MIIKGDRSYGNRTWKYCDRNQQPAHQQNQTGDSKKPSRTHQKVKAKAAPAVPVAAKVRGAISTVGRERCWNLGNAETVHPCLDDHLQGKLHPATLQFQFLNCFFSKTTEAAIKIAALFAGKKQTPDRGQKGITEVSVQRRHRVWCDAAAKTVSHDQIVTLAKLFDEGKQGRKIVTLDLSLP